jgi:Uma2 family endonuclease
VAIQAQPLPGSLRPHRFTVAEFEALLDTPVFIERTREKRFELVDGAIYAEPPVNDPHWLATQFLLGEFARLGRRLLVGAPVIITDFDEPAPDLAVLRADFPFLSEARGEDLLLVIEVSDRTRLIYDREIKTPRYLAGGVAEVWLVNLVDRRLETWRPGQLAVVQRVGGSPSRAERVSDVAVDLDALFAAAYPAARP